MMALLSLTVGRLRCKQVREYLEEKAFIYDHFKFHEGSGFFERKFTIVGRKYDVLQVGRELSDWIESLN